MTHPEILTGAAPLLSQYDVVFCDIWGVVHNGRTAYEAGCAALAQFRQQGGTVILVSNAPRTAIAVAGILDEKGVRVDCWDAIVPSGDLALARAAALGLASVHHIGPDRDLDIFDGSELARVPMAEAEAILCTGLIDDRRERAEDYLSRLEAARGLGLPFICANPDLVVDVGGDLLLCAGSIAAIYETMGGEVYWAGKPFAVAYEAAAAYAVRLRGAPVTRERILAIGDAVRTDIAGASAYGIDALFIGQGIHRDEIMPDGTFDAAALTKLFAGDVPQPVAAMTGLAW